MKWFAKDIKIVTEKIAECVEILGVLKEMQEEKNENYPENLQRSDRFQIMEERIYTLEEAIDMIDEAQMNLNDMQ